MTVLDIVIAVGCWMLIPACVIAKAYADRQSAASQRALDAAFEARRREVLDARLDALRAIRIQKREG